ncbi:MAG: hypothetical protein IPJ43_05875 [Saprospiraceae bacterium]|nr:hypothetical protein [Saprospiraceae bacterium]
MWAWGKNDKAQLGDTLVYFRNTPTQVGTASNWKTLNGCDEAAVALKTDGTIWAWEIIDLDSSEMGLKIQELFHQ